MKVAIVNSSDLIREGRWDAGFHIALKELGDVIDQLRLVYDEKQAIDIVDAVPLADKMALDVLRTGAKSRSMDAQEAHDVTVRYPHFALALVKRDVDVAITRIRQNIARHEESLKRLIEIGDIRITRLSSLNTANN